MVSETFYRSAGSSIADDPASRFLYYLFFNGILAPLLVAIVLAYLLEWPTHKLQLIGFSRVWAVIAVLIVFGGITLLSVFVIVLRYGSRDLI